MKKRLPKFKTDEEVAGFLEQDLSEYLDTDNLVAVSFEFSKKDKVVNLRMPAELLRQLKTAAKKRKMPYQRFIRQTLELSLKKDGTTG